MRCQDRHTASLGGVGGRSGAGEKAGRWRQRRAEPEPSHQRGREAARRGASCGPRARRSRAGAASAAGGARRRAAATRKRGGFSSAPAAPAPAPAPRPRRRSHHPWNSTRGPSAVRAIEQEYGERQPPRHQAGRPPSISPTGRRREAALPPPWRWEGASTPGDYCCFENEKTGERRWRAPSESKRRVTIGTVVHSSSSTGLAAGVAPHSENFPRAAPRHEADGARERIAASSDRRRLCQRGVGAWDCPSQRRGRLKLGTAGRFGKGKEPPLPAVGGIPASPAQRGSVVWGGEMRE